MNKTVRLERVILLSYTIEDFIKDLSKFPKDTQLRVREYEEYSEIHYKLSEPALEEEGTNGGKVLVIY